jgi:Ca2+-transporting ATPase
MALQRQIPPDRMAEISGTPEGLSAAEVERRRARYGRNLIVESERRPWWDLFRDTAGDPMLWFLLGTGVLYAGLGETTESITLFVSILPLAGMDAYLHRRTRASIEGLGTLLATRACVVREGGETEVPAADLVVGDLVRVPAGQPFPADGWLCGGDNIQVDESALTGESLPVRKAPLAAPPLKGECAAIEARSVGFAGTRLLTGRAEMRIVFIGAETLYGEIVRMAGGGARARTPLQSAVARLVLVLTAGAAVICLLLAWLRLQQGYGWLDALVSAATLGVAALPEEFPVVLTVFLGAGVYRLARQKALVRRAVSVENLGRVTCICSDKTGTITEGRLVLTDLLPSPGEAETGLLRVAALASRRETLDPLDLLILAAAAARGVDGPPEQVAATWPFTEDRRRETTLVREANGSLLAAMKGSPEVILDLCNLGADERAAWMARVGALAEEGKKVLACASRPMDGVLPAAGSPVDEPRGGFGMRGLLACADRVRPGVREAVLECRRAGIHVLMVTGDHPSTARAVARQIGLGGGEPAVIGGDDVERLRGANGHAGLMAVDVVARALPSQKLSLVRTLQAGGEIVAVTGDGVNDVPALRSADIGISMGERGTRSAREVASIVLMDDNFRTIVGAIGEGRQLFRNLQKSFQYLTIPLIGFPLLYLPIHIIWLEMIIHPTALLAFQEPSTGRGLARDGAPPRRGIFAPGDWLLIATVGTLVTLLITLIYFRNVGSEGSIEHARAAAVGTLSLSAVLIQVPALARLLRLTPLHTDEWAWAMGGGLLAVGVPILVSRLRRMARRLPLIPTGNKENESEQRHS